MIKHIAPNGDENPFVYFMISPTGSEIRVGWTQGLKSRRLETHKSYGYKVLALVPGTKQDEDKIHSWFKADSVGRDGDTSHYYIDRMMAYVQRLLEFNYGSGEETNIRFMSRQPWGLWSPEALSKPLYDGDQGCLIVTEGIKSRITDTWQTPKYIADVCRSALGGHIDLDPASVFEANLRIKADHFYDEKTNGLIRPWHGSVFLNPPYGGGEREPIAEKFIDKLISELTSGRVIRALTVLNLQSVPTLWFPKVRAAACCHAIWAKRINFIGPKAKSGSGAAAFSSSKNGTIFSFFGAGKEQFQAAFKSHAMVVEEKKER